MKQYQIGDTAWYAYYEYTSVKIPCPICFGKKQITLILGDESSATLPCDFCGKGLDEPTGQVTEYRYIAKALPVTVTRIESKQDVIGEERRYYYNDRCFADIEDLFDTNAEALARCEAKIAKQKQEDESRAEHLKANQRKSFSWNAGYHLRQASEHRKRAAYHERKAILCKERKRSCCNEDKEAK